MYSAWSFSFSKNWQGFIHYTVHISFSVGTIRSTGQKERVFFKSNNFYDFHELRLFRVESRNETDQIVLIFAEFLICWVERPVSISQLLGKGSAVFFACFDFWVLRELRAAESGQQQRPDDSEALCDLTKKMWNSWRKMDAAIKNFFVKSESAVQWIKSFDEKNRV